MRRASLILEVRTLLERAAPLNVRCSNEFGQQVVGVKNPLDVACQDDLWLIDVVEKEFAGIDLTEKHGVQRAGSVAEVAVQARVDLCLDLLLARDGRCAFHGAGSGQAADRFAQGELAILADFPFEFGIGVRRAFGLIVVHFNVTSRIGDPLFGRPASKARRRGWAVSATGNEI